MMEENFLNTKMIPIRFSFRYFVIYINRFHYNVSLTLNAKLRQLVLVVLTTESSPEAIITEYNCHIEVITDNWTQKFEPHGGQISKP